VAGLKHKLADGRTDRWNWGVRWTKVAPGNQITKGWVLRIGGAQETTYSRTHKKGLFEPVCCTNQKGGVSKLEECSKFWMNRGKRGEKKFV